MWTAPFDALVLTKTGERRQERSEESGASEVNSGWR
jgi:hypothetical protein